MLLFGDSRSPTSTSLVGAALRAAASAQPRVVVAGLVDASPVAPGRPALPRALAAELGRRVFEPGAAAPGLRRELPGPTFAALARRHGVPLIAAPGGDVNDPGLVRRLEDDIRPDGALTLLVGQLFGAALLAACRRPANFHDALLPAYRGIGATAWSVYHGERRSGFTFHHMTEGVDDGPILLQDGVAVAPRAVAGQVMRAKTRLAHRRMREAIERLAEGDAGRPQDGEASSFTRAHAGVIRAVPDPAAVTFDDLRRRLRAFELVRIHVGDDVLDVTSVRRVEGAPRHPSLAFSTADGVRAEPSRFIHLPWSLFRVYRRLL